MVRCEGCDLCLPRPRSWCCARADASWPRDGSTGRTRRRRCSRASRSSCAVSPSWLTQVDVVELCLPHSDRSEKPKAKGDIIGNTHRGVRGLWLRHGSHEERVCPTEMLARNARFEDIEGGFRKQAGISTDEYVAEAEVRSFDAHQLLVRVKSDPAVVPMFRGNTRDPARGREREEHGSVGRRAHQLDHHAGAAGRAHGLHGTAQSWHASPRTTT